MSHVYLSVLGLFGLLSIAVLMLPAARQRQARLPAHPERVGRIVFLDETSINTKMARLRGRCPSGQRMVAAIPHGHWKTMTFIAGLRGDGLTAPWVP